MTDAQLRELARKYDGKFHGPIVEHLSIPESKFFEMMRDVIAHYTREES